MSSLPSALPAAKDHAQASSGSSGDYPKRHLSLRFSRWTIGAHTTALVLSLAVPLNLVIFGVIWHLVESASEAQRTSLLYTARSVAAAVDAELGKYVALAEVLSRYPTLLADNLDVFETEVRRALPSNRDAWAVVAEPSGQQLFNTARPKGERLPIFNALGLASRQQALKTRSIVISNVRYGMRSQTWIINIDVPIFKEGQPFRVFSITRKAESFLHLLNHQDIPQNWIASIIDREGRIIARVPSNEKRVGRLTSDSWRKVMTQDGVFDRVSVDGDPIVSAQAGSSVSGWHVGIAVKKVEILAAAWRTIRWGAITGIGLSILSLLLARTLSRRITGPIAEIRHKAAIVLTGPVLPTPLGPPEINELWQALQRSAADRNSSIQALRESEERLRDALFAAQRAEEELSQVLGSTIDKQEAERQRIARELHDTFGQTLTLLKLGLDDFSRASHASSGERSKLAALKGLVSQAGSEMNRLAWEIRPTALDDLGLETAIRQLVETWSERSNLQFGLHLALNDRRMNPAVETTLYRVLQEAITNIAKHAAATRAGVLLEASAKEVRMIVEDDGQGFSPVESAPAGISPKGLGLLGIRERLSLVSGTLEVESALGRGCTLFVRVPL
jgi:signal transduction histidine kinase